MERRNRAFDSTVETGGEKKEKNVETFTFDKRLNDAGRAKRGSRRFLLKFNRDESGGEQFDDDLSRRLGNALIRKGKRLTMRLAESTVGISDVHSHLQDGRLGDDLTVYFERARARGVRRFVCCGTSPADWKKTAEIAKKNPDVFPTFGVHPWNVGRIDGDWATALKIMFDATRCADGVCGAAVGEVGLDFAVRNLDEAAQEAALRTQLEIANERRLPVVVHSVRANDLTLKILREYSKVPVWLLHSWTASEAQIERALETNVFFSFSPRSVAPNAVRARETVVKVPRDRILVESDAPTPLPPNGYGKPLSPIASFAVEARDADGTLLSAPASVVEVAEEIAALRKTPIDEFYRQLALNEKRFFQSWPTR